MIHKLPAFTVLENLGASAITAGDGLQGVAKFKEKYWSDADGFKDDCYLRSEMDSQLDKPFTATDV